MIVPIDPMGPLMTAPCSASEAAGEASAAVGTESSNRLNEIARLRSTAPVKAPASNPATAMPSVLALAATPISDGMTP